MSGRFARILGLGTFHAVAFAAVLVALTPLRARDLVEFPTLPVALVLWATTVWTTDRWLEGLPPERALAATIGTGALWGALNGLLVLGVVLLAAGAASGTLRGALAYLAIAGPIAGVLGALAGGSLALVDLGLFAVAPRLAPTVRTGP